MSDTSTDAGNRKPLCRLMICCNDPDNGEFTGECCGIDVRGVHVMLDRPVPMQDESAHKWLILGEVGIRYHHHGSWVGSWCWESYHVTEADALQILEMARREHGHIESAPAEPLDFMAAWDTGAPLVLPGPE